MGQCCSVMFGNTGIGIALSENTSTPTDFSITHSEFIPYINEHKKAETLAAYVKKNKLKGTPTYGVLNPRFYQLLSVKRPPVSDAELMDALRWQIKDQISYPPEQAVFDIFTPIQGDHSQPHVYLACTPMNVIHERMAWFKKAGLKLVRFGIMEIALHQLLDHVSTDHNDKHVLLYFSAQQNVMVLNHQGQLQHSCRLPSGLDSPKHMDKQLSLLTIEVKRQLDAFLPSLNDAHFYLYADNTMAQPLIDALQTQLGVTIDRLQVDHVDKSFCLPLAGELLHHD